MNIEGRWGDTEETGGGRQTFASQTLWRVFTYSFVFLLSVGLPAMLFYSCVMFLTAGVYSNFLGCIKS